MPGMVQGTEVLGVQNSITHMSPGGDEEAPAQSPHASWLKGAGFAVLALDPHPIHRHLFPTVHLQSPINQILDFLQPSCGEQMIQFIWKQREGD